MKYSVIIPVYNSADYLEACVQSVIDQSSDSKFEIILVDDGSTDGSGQLCDELSEKISCIRVIHQPNQGVSSARNAGIGAAQGQYLLFLDADDLLHQDLLTHLDTATETQPDLIQFGVCTFSQDGRCLDYLPPATEDGETGQQYLQRVFAQSKLPLPSSCCTAYRSAFLRQQELLFPVGIRVGEDFIFRMGCLDLAQCVFGLNMPLYRYRIHQESVTRTPSLEAIRDHLTVYMQLFREYQVSVLADFYCTKIPLLAHLSPRDAKKLIPFLEENRDLLKMCKGKKARITRILLQIFGWYNGAKLIQLLSRLKKKLKM